MPDLRGAFCDLRSALGNFLDRHREDGVFHVQLGGPGSVPALAGLDVPELHVDLLPGHLTPAQECAILALGYRPEGPHWSHPGGWRLVMPDETSGWRAEQQALGALLRASPEDAAAYALTFRREGRQAADEAWRERAAVHHARTVRFAPAQYVARTLTGLDFPWMFAGGCALDLHLGHVTRPHDDLDVVVPRDRQLELQQHLLHLGWRLDASVSGTYQPWTAPLEPPSFQVHARHPELPDAVMVDLMLTDLSDGRWRYRRDPDVTLPLVSARQWAPHGLPYLTPEAVLLFKAGRPGSPLRVKDERDFSRLGPSLTVAQGGWLRRQLERSSPGHPWTARLTGTA